MEVVSHTQANVLGEVELKPGPQAQGEDPVALIKLAVDRKILAPDAAFDFGVPGDVEVRRTHRAFPVNFDGIGAEWNEHTAHQGALKKIQIGTILGIEHGSGRCQPVHIGGPHPNEKIDRLALAEVAKFPFQSVANFLVVFRAGEHPGSRPDLKIGRSGGQGQGRKKRNQRTDREERCHFMLPEFQET